ncbi:MAG: DNA adenine methylase [Lachnospiraceae bacterium]|nr:DNA adenine methylase [Lachnospiraceae bacterium]
MKYLGSKSRIVKDILPYIQSTIDKEGIDIYIEPFCGGANVIDKVYCKQRIGADNNSYLIALLDGIANKGFVPYETVSKELYDKARQAFYDKSNIFTNAELGCIGFLASYNGRFFDGGFAKAGYEQTKNGPRYRDYYQESKRNLLNQANALKGIRFVNIDYESLINSYLNDNSNYKVLFYCDPPYANTKQYATSVGFDHERFWENMRRLSKKTYVLISEENAPADFECIWDKAVSRSIKAQAKSTASEKLFIYREGLLHGNW